MKFMTVDASIDKFAIAIFDNEKLLEYREFDLSKIMNKNETERRINTVKKIINKILDKRGISSCFLEDIFLNTYGKTLAVTTFKILAKLQGVILDSLYETNILSDVISAGTWRKTCGIKGRKREEQKTNTIKFVKEKYDIDGSEDICDAIALGHHVAKKIIPKIKIK